MNDYNRGDSGGPYRPDENTGEYRGNLGGSHRPDERTGEYRSGPYTPGQGAGGGYTPGGYNNTPPEPEKPYTYNFDDYQTPSGGDPKPPKKGKKGLIVFFSIVAVIVVVSLVSFTGYGVYVMMTGNNFLYDAQPGGDGSGSAAPSASEPEGDPDAPKLNIESAPQAGGADVSDGGLTNEAIAEKVSPSTVRITNYQSGTEFGVAGEGTGIILSADGYIVTNEHVVAGATGLQVTLGDNESYNAKLIGGDTMSDLAVIKLLADPMPKLTPAEFGDSDALKLGERVIAIGNAGGSEFAGSVTGGMISGLNRQITNEEGATLSVIQTDAAINPGNSGGPLINKYGQVVGINSAKYTREYFEGIGFAIPINTAKPIVDDLIEFGRVTGRARLGVQFYPYAITPVTAQYMGLPSNVTGGLVLGVDTECDVARQGIVVGDVVMTYDGNPVDSIGQLQNYIINSKKPGDKMELEIYRPAAQRGQNGKRFTVTVTLDEDTGETHFPEDNPQLPQPETPGEGQGGYGGGEDDGYGSFPFPFFPFY